MGIVKKLITGMVISVGTELVVKRVLPAAIKKSKKIIKELEEKVKQKGE